MITDTRPDTAFVDGVCSACISFAKRPQVDWAEREKQLVRILETHRNRGGFDCIVPSSGGKDSTWQTLKLLELGARPLVVTASTCMLTKVGRANIDNLARYATTIEVTPNTTVRAKLNRIGLLEVGDISWPEHASIFSTPFRVACDMGIPLIFYGENPQEAYGGPLGTEEAQTMTRRWVSEFGGFLGLRPSDMVGREGITERDMLDYQLPPQEKLARCGVRAFFLGAFYKWDSHRNAEVAIEHGMRARLPSTANWWKAENLDNAMTGIHDYFGYLKFGYGRLAAQISVDIREGLISREDAMDEVRHRDGMFPVEYMGVSGLDVLRQIGVSEALFDETVEKFTNVAAMEWLASEAA